MKLTSHVTNLNKFDGSVENIKYSTSLGFFCVVHSISHEYPSFFKIIFETELGLLIFNMVLELDTIYFYKKFK